jgi:hypothetical protein
LKKIRPKFRIGLLLQSNSFIGCICGNTQNIGSIYNLKLQWNLLVNCFPPFYFTDRSIA